MCRGPWRDGIFSFGYLLCDAGGKRVPRTGDIREKVVGKVLVAHGTRIGCDFAHVALRNGVDDDLYAVDRLVEDIKWLGCQRVMLKSDNGKAIVKLLTATLQELRYGVEGFDQAAEEHPTTHDSSGKADVEVAVERVTGIARPQIVP